MCEWPHDECILVERGFGTLFVPIDTLHLIVSHIFAVHSASETANRNEWKETGIHIVLNGRECEKNGCTRLLCRRLSVFLSVRCSVPKRQIVPKAPAKSFRKRIAARSVRLSSRRRIDTRLHRDDFFLLEKLKEKNGSSNSKATKEIANWQFCCWTKCHYFHIVSYRAEI